MQRLQKMFTGTGSVFWVTAGLSAALILWGALFTDNSTVVITVTCESIIANLYWFYMIVTSLFLGFCIWLAFSRYGKIRLGKDDERPEFGRFA